MSAHPQAHAHLAGDAIRRRLAATGRSSLRIATDSMRPVLPTGSRVFVRPPRPGEDLRGSVVAIDTPPGVVVHQVTRSHGSAIISRAIAARADDPPRALSDILGVVTHADGVPLPRVPLRLKVAVASLFYRLRNRVRPVGQSVTHNRAD